MNTDDFSDEETDAKSALPDLPEPKASGQALRVVIPGEIVAEAEKSSTEQVILGPGLRSEGCHVFATVCGLLCCRAGPVKSFWVNCHAKRYVPQRGENVIGIVTAKTGDFFRVDIGAAHSASLSYLAFEGATKRNRPDVKVGDLIYARIVSASKDFESELVCVDSYGKKAGMGVLPPGPGGFLLTVPLNLVRKVLLQTCPLLSLLGKQLPFEIAVGMNGRLWISSKSVSQTILIANCISVSEHMTTQDIRQMCAKLSDVVAHF